MKNSFIQKQLIEILKELMLVERLRKCTVNTELVV